MAERIGVMLLNMGGPDSPDAIAPFLRNLFADRDIIRLPGGRVGQALISRLIVSTRLSSVRKKYGLIGGKSPLLELTLRQASALEASLSHAGLEATVSPAMRYWHPFVAETLADFADRGIRRLVALSLYPHYSTASTGSVVAELMRQLAGPFAGAFDLTLIDRWPTLSGYLDALAATIDRTVASVPADRRERVTMLFSAHGLPEYFIEQGDPYVDEIGSTIQGVLDRTRADLPWRLSYQSRVGPQKWLRPTTPDTLEQLAAEGCTDVVVVPISFVTDHIETLVEIDREFAELAEELGFQTFERTPPLNDDADLIGALAGLVVEAVQPPQETDVGAT